MLTQDLIITLLVILTSAWFMGFIFSRMGLPVMLGEIVAGLIIGPPILGIVQMTDQLEFLAELGIFLAMFHAGMEMDPKKLLANIWPSIATAIGGFVLPFVLGFFVTKAFGGTVYQALFIGVGLSVTAIAVQAVILENMQIHRSDVGHVILGAAIVDDILSLVTLSILIGMVKSGTLEIHEFIKLIFKVVLFFGVTILSGEFLVPFLGKRLKDIGGKAFTFAILVALFFGLFAEKAGLHFVIGAFLAGQFVRRGIPNEKVYEIINTRFYGLSYGFLTPIFFVSLAFHLHIDWSVNFILFASAITLVAVFGKVAGCFAGVRLFGRTSRESLLIGYGMNGRGAVELVIAAIVISLSNELMAKGLIVEPLLTGTQFSALVFMAFVTTLITPLLMKASVMKSCSGDEKESFCALIDKSKKE
ncbi:MAG: cation:proton antiporter [Proteobacteria bacterium]|nr:cation:proton antiporter [Pseudomonadota bacterium]MBU1711155.1 cation:proton antiporter [Pseudomonadota bacterium]